MCSAIHGSKGNDKQGQAVHKQRSRHKEKEGDERKGGMNRADLEILNVQEILTQVDLHKNGQRLLEYIVHPRYQ